MSRLDHQEEALAATLRLRRILTEPEIERARRRLVARRAGGAEVGLADLLVEEGVVTASELVDLMAPVDATEIHRSPAAALGDLEPGDRLGRFVIEREVARGGMGIVYRARDPELGRVVALKVAAIDHPDIGDRFLQEARVSGQLEHPNIAPVHDLRSTAGGRAYFVMKFVAGRTLAELIDEETDDPARRRGRRLHDFLKVCDAVAYAHSRAIVHRDLKPENIMIGAFGEVLVMDWGLARIDAGVEAGGLESSSDERRTMTGTILGTVGYMAPEQATGRTEEVSTLADVFALGAVLHEILAGRPAYPARNLAEYVDALRIGRPAPSGASRELDAIVSRAMSPEPLDRYPSVADLQADVERYLTGDLVGGVAYGPGQRVAKWAGRHPALAAAASAAVLALTLGVGTALALRARRATATFEAGQAAWDEGETAAPFHPASPQEHFQVQVAALHEMGRGLESHPRPGPARRQLVASRAAILQERAEEVGNWALARIVVETAWSWGAFDEAERIRRLAGVAAGREAAADEDRARLDEALERIARAEGKRFGILQGEVEERARRLAGRSERSLTTTIAARLEETPPSPCRLFLIDLLGRLGDPGDGQLAAVVTRALADCDRADEVAAWVETAARIEADRTGAFGDLDRLLDGTEARWSDVAVVGRTIAAARRRRALAAGAELRPLAGGDAGLAIAAAEIEALGEWLAGRVRSGADFTRLLLERVDDEGMTLRQRLFVLDLLGLHGDSRPPDPAADARGPLAVLRRLGRRLPPAWRTDRRPSGAPPGDWTARRAIALASYVNRSRLDDPTLAPELFEIRRTAGDDSAIRRDSALAMALAPMTAWPAPATAEDWHRRGLAHLDRLEIDAARSDLDRALALRPDHVESIWRRAEVEAMAGDLLAARAGFDRAVALAPDSTDCLLVRGKFFFETGQLPAARADFDRVLAIDPDEQRALSNRAITRTLLGDAAGGLVDIDRSLARAPDSPRSRVTRAQILHRLGRLEEAFAACERAIALDPRLLQAYNTRANLRVLVGDPAGAVEDYGRAIDLHPGEAVVYYNRGKARAASGDRAGARVDFDRALALYYDPVKVRLQRGQVLLDLDDLPGARADFSFVVETSPDIWEAWRQRGVVRARLGDRAGAALDFDQALAVCPERFRHLVVEARQRYLGD